jgi:HSP20 family protein
MLVKVRRYPMVGLPSVFDLDRNINELLSGFLQDDEHRASQWSPRIDVVEEEEKYVVHAELPGVRKEDLKVSVHDGHVTINAERKNVVLPESAKWRKNEITFGQFNRTIPLPGEVKVDEIAAELSDGILEVSLPKSESARVREIKVK